MNTTSVRASIATLVKRLTCAAPSTTELQACAAPAGESLIWIDTILPSVTLWFAEQEAILLARGRPLDPSELDLATKVGVVQPGKVRVLVTNHFPVPSEPKLFEQTKEFGLGSRRECGRAMGYAVLLKPKAEKSRWLLVHELAHVAQRERLGTEGFLRRYLLELRVFGYGRAPLEAEADEAARVLTKRTALTMWPIFSAKSTK